MLLPFAAMAGGFLLIFRGLAAFDCASVSFSRHFTTCYQTDIGALPGAVAGGGMLAVGAILFFAGMLRMSTVR